MEMMRVNWRMVKDKDDKKMMMKRDGMIKNEDGKG